MTRATTLTSVAALVTAIAAAGGVYAGHGSASALSTPTYTLRRIPSGTAIGIRRSLSPFRASSPATRWLSSFRAGDISRAC